MRCVWSGSVVYARVLCTPQPSWWIDFISCCCFWTKNQWCKPVCCRKNARDGKYQLSLVYLKTGTIFTEVYARYLQYNVVYGCNTHACKCLLCPSIQGAIIVVLWDCFHGSQRWVCQTLLYLHNLLPVSAGAGLLLLVHVNTILFL